MGSLAIFSRRWCECVTRLPILISHLVPVPFATPSSKCPCTSPTTMLVPTTLQTNTLLQFGNFSDPSPTTTSTTECPQPPQRFPHIRAQLAAIARQHKDPGGIELDDDIGARMPSEFVHKVVESLDNEREDELKALLTETHPNMDSESVSVGMTYYEYSGP
jgi:hypothetical protein